MNLQSINLVIHNIIQLVGAYIPKLVGAILILVIGWILALIISQGIQKIISRTNLNKRLSNYVTDDESLKSDGVDKQISKGVFYLIMLVVLVGFFQVLGLTLITEPLNQFLNSLFAYAPRIIGAVVLFIIVWVVASILRFIMLRVLTLAKIDEKVAQQTDFEKEKEIAFSKSVSNTLYYLVFILFLPAIVGVLAIEGLFLPLQGMIDKILSFLPNIFTAILILLVGIFFARILRRLVNNFFLSVGLDNLSESVGISKVLGDKKLSKLTALIVYILILIPLGVAVLNALQLDAVTRPASQMLNKILLVLPSLLAAVLILTIGFVVGRLISKLITKLLSGIGFDNILNKIGISVDPEVYKQTPSAVVGYISLILILMFSLIESFNVLGFSTVSTLIAEFIIFGAHVVFGVLIFSLGLYLSNLVGKILSASTMAHVGLVLIFSKFFILLISGAMALRQMGLAIEIINLAFGLTLGAIAVASAIAFGLGGKDIAEKKLDQWINKIKNKDYN